MPYSELKPWWMRVDWPLWLTGLVLLCIWVLVAKVVLAGGPVALTWDQANDCGVVTGWELLQAPVTTANPNPQPTAAVVGVSIPNTGPPCGLAMTRTVNVSSIGPTRFWLRAVANAGKSTLSGNVDANLPFAAPSGFSLVVQ